MNRQRCFPIFNIFHRNSFPYIIWKTDDNAEGKASRIFIRRVATLFSENITPVVQIELCVGFWGWSHIPRGSDHPDLGGGQRRGAERCRGTLDPLQVAETPWETSMTHQCWPPYNQICLYKWHQHPSTTPGSRSTTSSTLAMVTPMHTTSPELPGKKLLKTRFKPGINVEFQEHLGDWSLWETEVILTSSNLLWSKRPFMSNVHYM